mmetsp:Transcript_50397/g.129818  ORF Transcript_50397/g.129818 Transcript_50397/m.129818 type:complete len:469 (-) Transcript_50397:1552-2958(-)
MKPSLPTLLKYSRSIASLSAKQLTLHQLRCVGTIGQPSALTHPHLLSAGHLTPGLSISEYAHRREAAAAALPSNSLLVLSSGQKQIMSNDIPYEFRCNTDFAYLTGILQPNVRTILDSSGKWAVFIEKASEEQARWDGEQLSEDAVLEHFGADEVHTSEEFEKVLLSKRKNVNFIYHNGSLASQLFEGVDVRASDSILHALRLRKSPTELDLIESACESAREGILSIMKHVVPGCSEADLKLLAEYRMRKHGGSRYSFPPVVAGGNRATTLHYVNCDQILREQDLVLFDGGCEKGGYCSDISRSFPVSGRFSAAQREVYEGVLHVQAEVIKFLQGGIRTLFQLDDFSLDVMRSTVVELGIAKRDISKSQVRHLFYPHAIGHFLGMDTHDTSSLPWTTKLDDGVVVTVEPGIYISEDNPAPDRFKGIGIRIEDNIAITSSGVRNLSHSIPSSVQDIEHYCNHQLGFDER